MPGICYSQESIIDYHHSGGDTKMVKKSHYYAFLNSFLCPKKNNDRPDLSGYTTQMRKFVKVCKGCTYSLKG